MALTQRLMEALQTIFLYIVGLLMRQNEPIIQNWNTSSPIKRKRLSLGKKKLRTPSFLPCRLYRVYQKKIIQLSNVIVHHLLGVPQAAQSCAGLFCIV